ncbi:DNA polymerase III subunit gamma/tau [Liquorilactobacillus oeni]|uniref:DNA-directed DNA polymerase n=1 Tax=Liquorilactobacillus oeni DSM 19972 TaxID=1423777 RepID=A0A0R1MG19_9LACO|nr:DNA polymerase III subunit gamma/tau [Liquorilactobacillus oeni]KRL04868.1 DNA polymerase III subunits gamma and tau [Liquorilactobacillus oeni DSM 19972]
MGYQALYRVWRPQRFADLVGQQMITQTLQNAIVTGQTSHAYLFTGPRGTGKTSAAKIFAKAVNCHFQKDGEPCNQCDICRSITSGRLNDVIEIDAASNNSVDEIREIRDKVKYAPTVADYKVYIIDEVHMLSTGAFNALLKTLEEPPANVVFILATTEPHKIPATIISRTQRFDFHRISNHDLFERMKYILEQKKLSYEEGALQVIAKSAEGGMRDALSILDQVLSFGDDTATLKNALLVTGSITQEKLYSYLQLVFSQQTAKALAELHLLLEEGTDGNRLVEATVKYCRDLLMFQTAPEILEKESLGKVNEGIKSLSKKLIPEELYAAIDVLDQEQRNMHLTSHTDICLEVMTVKLTHLKSEFSRKNAVQYAEPKQLTVLKKQMKELQQLVKKLQQGNLENNVLQQQNKHKKTGNIGHTKQTEVINLKKIYPILTAATRENLIQLKDVWTDLMSMLSITQRAIMNVSEPVAASSKGVIISFRYDFLCEKASGNDELKEDLVADLEKLTKIRYDFVFLPQNQWPEVRKQFLQEHGNELEKENEQSKKKVEKKPSEPLVKKAVDIFGKNVTEIVDVKED